ncbi:hypothetical protein ABFS83_13G113800 [Erythranthe nasuta]
MKRRKEQNNVVSIPELDDDVLDSIFSHLPIKEVRGLSTLSHRFRYSWKFCRNLSFDRHFAGTMSTEKFIKSVNYFFKHSLSTSADKFKLYFDATNDVNLVSFWTQKAVNLGIKEFELDLTPTKNILMLSWNLIDVETVKSVTLVNCELHLPLNSNGLRHLKELTLRCVRARPVLVKAVLANCSSLTTFRLVRCSCIYNLRILCGPDLKRFKTLVVENCSDYDSVAIINAPSLCSFRYRGKICEFRIQCHMERLNDVAFEIEHSKDFRMLPHKKEMVVGIAYVRHLTISSAFLEGLTSKFEEMEFYFWRLLKLQVTVASESYINPSDIANFLRKCPRIENVFIDIGQNAFGSSPYWIMKGRKCFDKWETLFPLLRYVALEGFTLKEQSITMARFFLKNAIYLRHLTLIKAKNYNFPPTFTLNYLVSGILSNARIELIEYNRESTTTMIPVRNSVG